MSHGLKQLAPRGGFQLQSSPAFSMSLDMNNTQNLLYGRCRVQMFIVQCADRSILILTVN